MVAGGFTCGNCEEEAVVPLWILFGSGAVVVALGFVAVISLPVQAVGRLEPLSTATLSSFGSGN